MTGKLEKLIGLDLNHFEHQFEIVSKLQDFQRQVISIQKDNDELKNDLTRATEITDSLKIEIRQLSASFSPKMINYK